MKIKGQKGISTADIVISVLALTVFITIIGNMIININLNSIKTERKLNATTYAIKEIEKIRALGYQEYYDGQGINSKEILEDEYGNKQDSDIEEQDKFTGYHKTIYIEDYVAIINDSTKEENVLKKITVEISYNLSGKPQNIELSTYITRE